MLKIVVAVLLVGCGTYQVVDVHNKGLVVKANGEVIGRLLDPGDGWVVEVWDVENAVRFSLNVSTGFVPAVDYAAGYETADCSGLMTVRGAFPRDGAGAAPIFRQAIGELDSARFYDTDYRRQVQGGWVVAERVTSIDYASGPVQAVYRLIADVCEAVDAVYVPIYGRIQVDPVVKTSYPLPITIEDARYEED
jgi:hypothetical protein